MANYILRSYKLVISPLSFVFIMSILSMVTISGQQTIPGTNNKLTYDDFFTRYQQGQMVNAHTKNDLPAACKQGAAPTLMSFIKTASPHVNHPSGGQLFPNDGQLGQLLTTFLTNLEQDETSRNFTIYFTKLHLLILHQLYIYLTKIYTVFNMSHIDAIQKYLTLDAKQALSKKTLIINHLINIIEMQSNGAIRARFPSIPKHLATYTGNMLMKQDYGAQLSLMLDKSEDFLLSSTDPQVKELITPTVSTMRDSYLSLFGDYLSFFHEYTQTLNQDDTSHGYVGFNTFAKHAQRIGELLSGTIPEMSTTITSIPEKVAWLRSLKKLNPPMFFYDAETMRGLKIIPHIAKSLPKNVQSIPYPQKLVEDAKKGVHYQPKFGPQTGMLIAFYQGDRLFVNIPTMQYPYTQELIPQPEWLNSSSGVIKMLQACLGDFSALLDPALASEDILDPCLQCIVQNASIKAGLIAATSTTCKICTAFIDSIQAEITNLQAKHIVTPSGPSGGGISTGGTGTGGGGISTGGTSDGSGGLSTGGLSTNPSNNQTGSIGTGQ